MTRSRFIPLLLLAASLASAKSPDKPKLSAISPDAQAYLDQVNQSLLQRTAGNPSFHLKASFTATQAAGTSAVPGQTGNGTYEETWISPTEWRKEIIFGNFHSVSGTENGQTIWIVQMPEATPLAVSELLRLILPSFRAPVPREHFNVAAQWKMSTVRLGETDLVRVGAADSAPRGGKREIEYAYYFDPQNRIPLLQANGTDAVHFIRLGKLGDKLVLISGTYVSSIFINLAFTIDSITVNPTPNVALFTAPSGAKIVDHDPVGASDAIFFAKCISCPAPNYPQIAKAGRISGSVQVQALIDLDGKVSDARAISGPPLLRQAAVDAVSQFRYEPVMMDGVPISIVVSITTVFTFNGG